MVLGWLDGWMVGWLGGSPTALGGPFQGKGTFPWRGYTGGTDPDGWPVPCFLLVPSLARVPSGAVGLIQEYSSTGYSRNY